MGGQFWFQKPYIIKQNPSASIIQDGFRGPQNLTSMAIDYPLKMASKTLLLTKFQALLTEYWEAIIELSWKLPHSWPVSRVPEISM